VRGASLDFAFWGLRSACIDLEEHVGGCHDMQQENPFHSTGCPCIEIYTSYHVSVIFGSHYLSAGGYTHTCIAWLSELTDVFGDVGGAAICNKFVRTMRD
jgi:hypothetical protein